MRHLLAWALAQMFGAELIYPTAAGEAVMAAIHYGTLEENDERAA